MDSSVTCRIRTLIKYVKIGYPNAWVKLNSYLLALENSGVTKYNYRKLLEIVAKV